MIGDSILASTLAPAEEQAKKDMMTVEYQSVGQYPTHGVTMAGALKALGVSLDKIDYLKLVGDESSMTTGLSKKVQIDEWFWDRYFETAEPYKYWVSSGNRRLEIYLKGESKPKTTIYINETDSCAGPVIAYDMKTEFILTKNAGRVPSCAIHRENK